MALHLAVRSAKCPGSCLDRTNTRSRRTHLEAIERVQIRTSRQPAMGASSQYPILGLTEKREGASLSWSFRPLDADNAGLPNMLLASRQ